MCRLSLLIKRYAAALAALVACCIIAGCSASAFVKTNESRAIVAKYDEKKDAENAAAKMSKGGGCAACGH